MIDMANVKAIIIIIIFSRSA